jgi:hypothetical protein
MAFYNFRRTHQGYRVAGLHALASAYVLPAFFFTGHPRESVLIASHRRLSSVEQIKRVTGEPASAGRALFGRST